MKTTRSKSKKKNAPQTAAKAAAASAGSTEQTLVARLEEVMKSLADTARKTSDPMELLRALLNLVLLNEKK